MALAIESVLPARFPTWVQRRPFSVVFVVDGASRGRPAQVVERLDFFFPDEIQVGWLSRDAVTDPDWWKQHWLNEVGPMNMGRRPDPGVYLFLRGRVVGFHPATRAVGTEETWSAVRDYLIERIRLRRGSEGGPRWDAPGGGAEGRSTSLSPPPPPPDEGPYELLEVAPSATDDEVKRAYRDAVRLNHPDRVATLSKAIQQFAHERMLLINAAWETVRKERGLR